MRILAGLLFLYGCSSPSNWQELAERSPEDAIGVVRVLEDHRTGAEIIRALLGNESSGVRVAAVLALGRLERPDFIEDLSGALDDTDVGVRRTAAFALGQLGGAEAEGPLLKRLSRERRPSVIVAIWRALGRVGGERSLQRAQQLKGMHRPLGITTIGLILRRLKRTGQQSSALVSSSADPDEEVRAGAFYALSRARGDGSRLTQELWSRAVAGLQSGHAAERDAAVRVLSVTDPRDPEALARIVLTGGLPAHQRAALVAGITRHRSVEATHALVRIASVAGGRRDPVHANHHWVLAATRGLEGRTLQEGQRRQLSRVRDLVGASKPRTAAGKRRVAALTCALGAALGEPEGCPPEVQARLLGEGTSLASLRPYLDHRRVTVRVSALHALKRLGGDMAAALESGLKDPDLVVVATAASLLAEARSPGMEVALSGAWKRAYQARDWEVAQEVLKAMAALETKGLIPASRQALGSGQLAMAHLGVKFLQAQAGEHHVVPVPPLPAFDEARTSRWAALQPESVVAVDTEVGTIQLRLLPRWAPRTVENFLALARKGYFEGLVMHRVVPNFVIQGGDPRGDGWGGPGYTIRCENSPEPYRTGTVGMALAGKDTGGSQWFITHNAQPHLFGRYPVFARVEKGQEVVDTIAPGDRILRIREL